MLEAFETMYIKDPVFSRDICCWRANSNWRAYINVPRRARADTESGSLLLTRAEQSWGARSFLLVHSHCGF